jgi:cytochrome c556
MANKALIIAAGLAFSLLSPAFAADDPIAARQELMKHNGGAAKIAVDMIKGAKPFDVAAAADAMKTLQDDMVTFVTLFPEGSDKGKTSASPKIWEDMDGFKAAAAKLAADAKTAGEAAAQGVDAFKVAFNAVGSDCGACHQAYRVKKD